MLANSGDLGQQDPRLNAHPRLHSDTVTQMEKRKGTERKEKNRKEVVRELEWGETSWMSGALKLFPSQSPAAGDETVVESSDS